MTDDPLVRVNNRLIRYWSERNERIILDPEALADARAALAQVQRGARGAVLDDPRFGRSPLWILGSFHVFRYTLLPEEQCLEALAEGASCCLPLYERDPGLLPLPLRSVIEQATGRGAGDHREELERYSISELRKSISRGDLAGIDAALRVGRSVLDITPAPDPRRVRLLCEMAAASGELYRLRRDDADLDAAFELVTEAEKLAAGGYESRVDAIKRLLLAERYRAQGK